MANPMTTIAASVCDNGENHRRALIVFSIESFRVCETGAISGAVPPPGAASAFQARAATLREIGPPAQIFSEPREARTRQFLQRVIGAGRL
jgi:hypothetical protein